jgi:hypothetical protein
LKLSGGLRGKYRLPLQNRSVSQGRNQNGAGSGQNYVSDDMFLRNLGRVSKDYVALYLTVGK